MEQQIAHNRKADRNTLVCVFLLALVFILLLWRAPFGYDWTDEEYYSVVGYRMLQGDRPLVDTWEVHQFSGMLAAPALGAYRLANGGSMDGSVLFLRYFYVSVQFLSSLFAYFTLKKRSGHIPALIAAVMMLAYTHYSINSYFYDSMPYLFVILSALMLFRWQDLPPDAKAGKAAFAALSGVCAALAVIAFPYALLAFLVYFVYWIYSARKNRAQSGDRFGALWFFAGAALTAGALAAFILSRTTLAQAADGVKHMLSDPDHLVADLPHVLAQYFNSIRVIYAPYSYGAALLVVTGLVYRMSKQPRVRQALRLVGAALALVIMAGVTIHMLTYKIEAFYRINLFAAGFALTAPGLWLLADRSRNRAVVLFAAGCALSLATQIGSNTRILASSGMLLPASMAAALYLLDNRRALFSMDGGLLPRLEPRSAKRIERMLAACAFAFAAVFALSLCTLRLTAVHRDEPVANLTAAIDSGAAKGIRTTPESAARHHAMVEEIRTNATESGAVLFTYLFPEGYLLTDLKAATPSAFNMAMDSQWLAAYYESRPDRVPAVVFALDPNLPYNDASMSGADAFANDYGLQTKRLTYMTVYRIPGTE